LIGFYIKTFQATIFVESFCNLSGYQVLFHTDGERKKKEMSRKIYKKGIKVTSVVDIE
jgi:hypothetical protein